MGVVVVAFKNSDPKVVPLGPKVKDSGLTVVSVGAAFSQNSDLQGQYVCVCASVNGRATNINTAERVDARTDEIHHVAEGGGTAIEPPQKPNR